MPLTSVDQRAGEIGKRTARMISTILEKEQPGRSRRFVLEPQLIARASSQIK